MMGVVGAMDVKLKWVYRDRDRNGNVRIYFWRKGSRKVRMRETEGSSEFFARYRALLDDHAAGKLGIDERPHPFRPGHGTLAWLVAKYFAECSAYKALDPIGQRTRSGLLKHILAEPVHPGARETFGECPVARLTTKAVKALRDRKVQDGKPAAGRNRVRAIRGVLRWAVEEELLDHDPSAGVRAGDKVSGGHHTWTDDEIETFEKRYPVGTRERLALAIMLYTGFRRSDVVELGRQHLRNGWIRKVQAKGRRRRHIVLEIPLLPALSEIIEASPCGDLTLLVNKWKRPFSTAGFGNWFREACDGAGLPHCSAHGLRKAGATRAAENGATAHQLMAIFGWLTLKEAELYTKAAQRKRLAADAITLMRR